MQDADTKRPQFLTTTWSGLGCAGVGCLSYMLFAIAQTIAAFFVLVRAHPDFLSVVISGTKASKDTITQWIYHTSTAPNLFIFALVGDGIMILVAILLARAFLNASLGQLGLGVPASGRQLLVGGITGIALIFASQIVGVLQAKFFGPHPQAVAELLKSHHGARDFLFDFFAVCVLAPFAEELLFRGVVFAGLAQRLPLAAAAVLSGIIFGAAHLDPWNIAPLAVIGAGLALLYNRTGSLWPNVVAHASVNALGLILVFFAPQLAT